MASEKGQMSFEEALDRLEENAQKMSSPQLPLEESLRLYAESVKLIDFCQKSIEKAELQIEMLSAGEMPEEPKKTVSKRKRANKGEEKIEG